MNCVSRHSSPKLRAQLNNVAELLKVLNDELASIRAEQQNDLGQLFAKIGTALAFLGLISVAHDMYEFWNMGFLDWLKAADSAGSAGAG